MDILCRLISNHEKEFVDNILDMHEKAWGVPLKNGKDIIKSRVDNGYILGAFSEGELIGNITFFQTTLKNIENSSGWSDITSNGTFDNFISDGDTLCCPAVSSKNGSPLIFTPSFFADAAWYYKKWAIQLLEKPFEADSELKKMIERLLPAYLESNLDPVIRFHKEDKFIIPGAKIKQIIPNGAPDDEDALGYNIAMEYPELTDEIKKRLNRPCMFCPSRIGEALILNVAFIAATKKEVKHIIAYSRPAGYRYYLARFFTMLANQHNNFIKPEEKIFFNKANKILN